MTAVLQIGNFEPPYSTENDLLRTMRDMGIEVSTLQEELPEGWSSVIDALRAGYAWDVIVWTRTASLSRQVPMELQRSLQYEARLRYIPTIAVHLDRWWGLRRHLEVFNEPFFRCEYVCTADGAHQDHWAAAGVNHLWSPPAIAAHNVVTGSHRDEYASDVAFVGSWQGGYHVEWTHRPELVNFLRTVYGERLALWPRLGEPAVRGSDLADLYASVKVVVGDSCLVPTVEGHPMTRYCSDRVFESIGRGAFLLHPSVRGITDRLVHPQQHLDTWELGDWADLKWKIDYWLDNDDHRRAVAKTGQSHVAEHHTYTNRLQAIFEHVEAT